MLRTTLSLFLLATSMPALAQGQRPGSVPAPRPEPARPAPAPTPAPDRTTQAFGDWVVRCENRAAESGNPASRNCEMAQGVQNQAQLPVAQIALGRLARNQPWRLVLAVPVNLLATAPARLAGEGADPQIPLRLRSCIPTNCTLEVELNEALLRQLRARDGLGRFEYRLADDAEMTIPVSFRGFATAFEALQREPD